MGPNMMWNTKYGMMRGGILGGIFGTPTTTMTVTATQATANAQQYLNTYLPGTTTGDVTTFYGYYTIEVLKRHHTLRNAKRQRLQRTSLVPHLARNLHTRTASKLSKNLHLFFL